jgi:hypothetical protein
VDESAMVAFISSHFCAKAEIEAPELYTPSVLQLETYFSYETFF